MRAVLHTVHRLAVQRLHLKFTGGKRLEELAESIVPCDGISVPHKRCFVQIQPCQILKTPIQYHEAVKQISTHAIRTKHEMSIPFFSCPCSHNRYWRTLPSICMTDPPESWSPDRHRTQLWNIFAEVFRWMLTSLNTHHRWSHATERALHRSPAESLWRSVVLERDIRTTNKT